MTIPKKTKLLLFVVGLVASLMLVKAELIGFDKFSADPASFGPELLTYFGTDLQTEDKKNIEEFIVFWNTGTYLTDEEKKQIVVLANNFLERKLLAVPYMLPVIPMPLWCQFATRVRGREHKKVREEFRTITMC